MTFYATVPKCSRQQKAAGYGGAWSWFLYITDHGDLAAYRQWNYLAAQLPLGGALTSSQSGAIPYQPISTLVASARYMRFNDIQFGYRLNVIVPQHSSIAIFEKVTLAFLGRLYKPSFFFGELDFLDKALGVTPSGSHPVF